jgi:hypothetical protein
MLSSLSLGNRILLAGKLQMDFAKQYDLLLELPPETRLMGGTKTAILRRNSEWWCVLAKARTIFTCPSVAEGRRREQGDS